MYGRFEVGDCESQPVHQLSEDATADNVLSLAVRVRLGDQPPQWSTKAFVDSLDKIQQWILCQFRVRCS